jgi:cardiolipin synthase
MEEMYLEDLSRSTEIVLGRHGAACPACRDNRPRRPGMLHQRGSVSRAGIGMMRMGNVVGAAISNRRTLEPAESKLMFAAGGVLLALAIMAVLWPEWLAVPFAILSSWIAASLFLRGIRLLREHRRHQHGHREGCGREDARRAPER